MLHNSQQIIRHNFVCVCLCVCLCVCVCVCVSVVSVCVSCYLVLQRAVFSLCLLADDDHVQVVVACAVPRQTLHMNHIGKQVQLSPADKPADTLITKAALSKG